MSRRNKNFILTSSEGYNLEEILRKQLEGKVTITYLLQRIVHQNDISEGFSGGTVYKVLAGDTVPSLVQEDASCQGQLNPVCHKL